MGIGMGGKNTSKCDLLTARVTHPQNPDLRAIMPTPRILVTGGCGYIGSHTLVDLIEAGFEVVSIDNLVNSSETVLDGIHAITGVHVPNIRQDLRDAEATLQRLREHGPFGGIIHFAALKRVEESVEIGRAHV